MEFPVTTGAPASHKTPCCILPVFEGAQNTGPAREVDRAARGALGKLVRAGDASAKLGSTLFVPRAAGTAAERWLLVGCGAREEFDAKRLRQALAAAVQALKATGIRAATSYLAYERPAGLDAYYAARLTVETVREGLYRFDELKSKVEPAPQLKRFGIAVADRRDSGEIRRGVAHGRAIANGMDLARNLGNRPPNVCTPAHIADAAREVAKRSRKLEVEVLEEREMKRLKMGALLAVTRGAGEPARLIVLSYRGGAANSAPVVLCGKGVTFDTGGISLKPPAKMDEMKFDMCGAAGVLGTLQAVAELGLERNVIAVVPACENMPDSQATRPGDIVTSMSGQTVEIINTDAEGRLILCDALAYAQRFKPRYLLDVATLTGACVIALGDVYTGLFSNDEGLATALLEAGKRSLDRAWRMPVDEEYGESLKSTCADFANSGSRDGGASIGAQFLSRFVGTTPWAHLDIAGVAWRAKTDKSATGRPVPLLTDFLLHLRD